MKKRTLSLFLALLLLLSVCTLFASCGEEAGKITVSENKLEVDLKGYTLLYAESASGNDAYKKAVNYFSTSLKNATGKGYSLKAAANATLEDDDLAIVIGDTDFSESKKAKKGCFGVAGSIGTIASLLTVGGICLLKKKEN